MSRRAYRFINNSFEAYMM